MANISPYGIYRALDADGAPLSGGKLYTYESGTSTPKPTYTDASGNTANTNPVILDANGYANIWLDVGGYKFVLTDLNDVVQWTTDNIDGGGSTGFASNVIITSVGLVLNSSYQNAVIVCTKPVTLSLVSAGIAGNGYVAVVINRSNGNVTIAADGAETINGASSYVVYQNGACNIHTNGSAWYVSADGQKEIQDDEFRILGSSDVTKKLAFEVDGLTTATTRTLTAQDASGTIYITGGQDVSVADGGTGSGTVAAARTVFGIASNGSAMQLVIQNNAATPLTQIDIDATSAVLVDSNGLAIRHTTVNLTVNAATVGANGLDAGSLANNTWYYLYIISNGTTAAGIASTSSTSPTMPSGYTYLYRVGSYRTDGSATFKHTIQRGNKVQYVVGSSGNTTSIPQMAAAPSGNAATPTWVAVATNSFVPPTASTIRVMLHYNGPSSAAAVAPNGNYGAYTSTTNPPPLIGAVGGSVVGLFGDIVLESTNIYFAAAAASALLRCIGWEENL